MTLAALASQVMERADILGAISDDPNCLTRTFLSPAMRRANDQVANWMREAGMEVREDSVGNLIGRLSSADAGAKTFVIGSHLDTVRDAGKYDGPLGVLVAIACVQSLRERAVRLPFHLEVYAFADEEGVRFHTNYLASGAVVGSLTEKDLLRTDEGGVTLAQAIARYTQRAQIGFGELKQARREPKELLGYAEVHIEQGPVLEKMNLACGVVSSITGQTRVRVEFVGRAGHAGTTPMELRLDALCAAAEFILAAESFARDNSGVVATVGTAEIKPGASNVIPGRVVVSLDVRHANDSTRRAAADHLQAACKTIVAKRGLEARWDVQAEASAAPCDSRFVSLLTEAVRRHQASAPQLTSGAGHDAAALAAIVPMVMLFVRCRGGISHNPAESVRADDVATAISVFTDFLESIQR